MLRRREEDAIKDRQDNEIQREIVMRQIKEADEKEQQRESYIKGIEKDLRKA
jgi:hypothetical protein